MVVGTVVTIVWKLALAGPTGLYELVPAFFCSALAIVLVSLVSPQRGITNRSGR
jgi:Na+/proline symporter